MPRSKNISEEILIRKYVRREIALQDKQPRLEEQWAVEMSAEEFDSAFVDPWVDVLKVIGKEVQRTLANVVLNVRLFFTFDKQKAEEILARHNDRIKRLDAELEETLGPLRDSIKGDGALLAMVLNPGGYLVSKAIDNNSAQKVKDWFKTAGFGDYQAGEIDSPDSDSERLAREREQQGPVRKALRALNKIFLLAHYEPGDERLLEQEELPKLNPKEGEISPEQISLAVEESGLAKLSSTAKSGFDETFKEITEALDGFSSQIEVISGVALSKNFEELEKGISEIKSALPELDVSELNDFKNSIQKQGKELLKDEKRLGELVKDLMESEGASEEIKDEEIKDYAKKNQKKVEQLAYQTIFMANTSELRSQLVGQLENSFSVYKGLSSPFANIPPDTDAAALKIIEDSGYSKKSRDLSNLLSSTQSKIQSAVSEINSFKPPKSLLSSQ